jgi:hypothetical protein
MERRRIGGRARLLPARTVMEKQNQTHALTALMIRDGVSTADGSEGLDLKGLTYFLELPSRNGKGSEGRIAARDFRSLTFEKLKHEVRLVEALAEGSI